MITVWVNGSVRTIAVGDALSTLLAEMELPPRGIAVAVNGEVVRRALWPECQLADGDRVDVLTAAQGG